MPTSAAPPRVYDDERRQIRLDGIDLDRLDLGDRIELLFRTRRPPHGAPTYRVTDIASILGRLGIPMRPSEVEALPEDSLSRLAYEVDAQLDTPNADYTTLISALQAIAPGTTPTTPNVTALRALSTALRPRPPREYHYTEVAKALGAMGIEVSETHLSNLRGRKKLTDPSGTLIKGLAAFFNVPVDKLLKPLNDQERAEIRRYFLDLAFPEQRDSIAARLARRLDFVLRVYRDNDGERLTYRSLARRMSSISGRDIPEELVRRLHHQRQEETEPEHLAALARAVSLPVAYFTTDDEDHVKVIEKQLELLEAVHDVEARGNAPVLIPALNHAMATVGNARLPPP